MMAEMPPSGGMNGSSSMPGRNIPPPITPTRASIAPDRVFILSIPGILNVVALGFAFAAMIAVEVGKRTWGFAASIGFHEFTTITSFLTLLIFTPLASLQIYRLVNIRGSIMKFVMLGHAAVWALLLLISSSLIIDQWGALSAFSATGALGLIECFALMGVVVLLVLDLVGAVRQPIFE